MWFNSNTTGTSIEAGTAYYSMAPEFIPVYSGVRVVQSLVLCVVFCRPLVVFFPLFLWPLHYLSFNLRLLITPFSIFKLHLPNAIQDKTLHPIQIK